MLIVSDICQDEKIRDEENLGTKNNSENEEEQIHYKVISSHQVSML